MINVNYGVRMSIKFPTPRRLAAGMASVVNEYVTMSAAEGAQWMRRGLGTSGQYLPSRPGSPPNRQRGRLAGSITATKARDFQARAGSNLAYAGIHERGGVITPKSSKYIPVPMNIAAQRISQRTGAVLTESSSGGGGWLRSRSGGLRSVPNLVPIRTKSGKLMLVEKNNRKTRVEWSTGGGGWLAVKEVPAWLLVKRVRIPRRPWCWPAVVNNAHAIHAMATKAAAAKFGRVSFGIRKGTP